MGLKFNKLHDSINKSQTNFIQRIKQVKTEENEKLEGLKEKRFEKFERLVSSFHLFLVFES